MLANINLLEEFQATQIRNRTKQLFTYLILLMVIFLLFSSQFTVVEWIFFAILVLLTVVLSAILYTRMMQRHRNVSNITEELNGINPVQLQYIRLALMDRDFNGNDYNDLLVLDTSQESRGLSASQLERLPEYPYHPVVNATDNSFEENICTICLDTLTEGAMIRSTPCMHVFHQACVDRWLLQKAVCPVCNQKIEFPVQS